MQQISAITLFVEQLGEAKDFYASVFGLPVVFEDNESAVFRFGETLVNLLDVAAAPDLIAPASVGERAGQRFVLTLNVDDVATLCAELQERGVSLLNGPIDRPWGVRTASFQDPAGHVWELAQPL